MTALWFCVPAHGRLALTAICLRQLRRTCDALSENGLHASAVIVADDENLDTARELGFATVERYNRFVSRKFNDGIQLACDPDYNPHPVSHVVPLGSDDWVDWRLFHNLPGPDRMVGFQRMAFVREDGCELTVRQLNNEGGSGIRIYPRQVMASVGYRPADEDRPRGCDTSILVNLKRAEALRWVEHRDLDPLQIVDWKSDGANLNSYREVSARHRSELHRDPFEALAGRFPEEALSEMQDHYLSAAVAA
jgi:hypothetical protein